VKKHISLKEFQKCLIFCNKTHWKKSW